MEIDKIVVSAHTNTLEHVVVDDVMVSARLQVVHGGTYTVKTQVDEEVEQKNKCQILQLQFTTVK